MYMRGPRDLRSVELAPGVELKAAGCQVVAPPSRHPCGRLYVWHPARPLIESEIARLPNWILQLAGLERSSGNDFGDLPARDPLHRIPASEYVPKLTGRPIDRRGYVRCPFHAEGRERTPSLKVYAQGGWKCFSCQLAGRIYQLAGLLGGWTLPLTAGARCAVRAVLLDIFPEVRV